MPSYSKSLAEAAQFIRQHDDFLVVSHLNPDGDAVGSSIAMGHLLRKLGKRVTVVNEGSLPKRFAYLTGYQEVLNLATAAPQRTFSTIITVDAADYERLGDISAMLADPYQLLNIDHHPTNTRFGNQQLIRSTAASTTEIVYDLVKQAFPEVLDLPLASALYTGLVTDTGGFRYDNTSQQVLQKASEMISYGVKPSEVAENALETITAAHLALLKQALQSLTFAFDHQVAMISVSTEDMKAAGASRDDVDGLVSYPRNIEGIEVGVLFKEWSETEIKVSLRSKKYVDVALLAQNNGGGGHAKASGYTYRGSLAAAQASLLEQLNQIFGGSA